MFSFHLLFPSCDLNSEAGPAGGLSADPAAAAPRGRAPGRHGCAAAPPALRGHFLRRQRRWEVHQPGQGGARRRQLWDRTGLEPRPLTRLFHCWPQISFWLIENGFSVLIAACDTFRAGAVEQLRTHTRRLNALHPPESHGGRSMVQLYEKGYGKDAAGIAMEAISYGRKERRRWGRLGPGLPLLTLSLRLRSS